MTGPVRLRDLLIVPLDGDDCLVLACDAAGGVGPKSGDSVLCSADIVGRFTARVALMEVLAAGAAPVALVCTACVEPDPTGAGLLAGAMAEARFAGLSPEAITGSSEKNLPTHQTGLGVTAIGRASRSRLRPGRARPGDLVVAIGRPKVGSNVRWDDPEIADLPLIRQLADSDGVHDILPVGSRGIAAELADLATSASLQIAPLPAPGWDLSASGGPSTCVLAALSSEAMPDLAPALLQPYVALARLVPTS